MALRWSYYYNEILYYFHLTVLIIVTCTIEYHYVYDRLLMSRLNQIYVTLFFFIFYFFLIPT